MNPLYEAEPWCDVCFKKNNKHVIDDNVYMLSEVVVNDTPDEEKCRAICSNFHNVLRLTTVRKPDNATETPGFCLFDPQLKAALKKKNGDGRKMSGFKLVTDRAIANIVRELLVMHSDKYKDSGIKVYFDDKFTYRVQLLGFGSQYCLNKGDHHTSQHVYLEIVKTGSARCFAHRMRCLVDKPRGVHMWDVYKFQVPHGDFV